MSDIYISWSEYHQTIEQLAVMIEQSGWKFNQIVCIAKGGLRIGDILSRLFDQPLAIISASSYGGEKKQTQGEIKLSKYLSMTTDRLGSKVLLVDDLVDSGVSLKVSLNYLKEHYQEDILEIRSAVLWRKECSDMIPNYYVHYFSDNPWIHQPFEKYEQMSLSDLMEQV